MKIPYENRCTILAMDPSTSGLGIAVLDVDSYNGDINIPLATTIHRNDLLRGHKWMLDVHPEVTVAVYCYGKAISELLEVWAPDLIAM